MKKKGRAGPVDCSSQDEERMLAEYMYTKKAPGPLDNREG